MNGFQNYTEHLLSKSNQEVKTQMHKNLLFFSPVLSSFYYLRNLQKPKIQSTIDCDSFSTSMYH